MIFLERNAQVDVNRSPRRLIKSNRVAPNQKCSESKHNKSQHYFEIKTKHKSILP
jgi:hypothetical protein